MAFLIYRWTINSVYGGGGTTPSVAEISLRATTGGSTINPPGTTHQAKDFYTSDPTYNADKAFDADISTFWNANTGTPNWISVTFTSAQAAVEYAWTARNDVFGGPGGQSPSSITLEGSNDGGSTWTALGTVTPTSWSAGQTQTFTITSGGGGGGVSIGALAGRGKLIGSGTYVP